MRPGAMEVAAWGEPKPWGRAVTLRDPPKSTQKWSDAPSCFPLAESR